MRAMWTVAAMLAGLAAGALPGVARAAEEPEAALAVPPGWFVFEAPDDDFSPSAIDCSRLVPAPTGQHGFVKVEGDHFAFEDGTPVRFWGVEFGPGRLGDPEYAIKRLRKRGVNMVRQHGMGGFTDRGAQSVLDFNDASFDRWDAWLAELGKQGIYACLDADYYMRVRPQDVPGLPDGGATQFLMFVDDDVARVKRERFKGIFTHVNHYNGKRWCDDPTLALVEIANEDSIFWHGVDTLPEPFKGELETKWKAWLTAKYGNVAALRTAWTFEGKAPLAEGEGLGEGDSMAILPMWRYEEGPMVEFAADQKRAIDQLRFFLDLENDYYSKTYQYMRDFGIKVPICATNWRGGGFSNRVHLAGQARLDYVDRHGYWDHPQGEGNLKWNIATAMFTNLPMVKALVAGQDPAQENNVGNLVLSKAWEQVLGKPLGLSEWNTCLPNEYSFEGAGLIAAYGLLQGWDAPIQSAINGSGFRSVLGPSSFDMHCDPPQFLVYPAVTTMWLRGDVAQAPVVAETLYTPESLFEYADDHRPLPMVAACIGKVGFAFVDKPREPIVKDIGPYWDEENLTAKSVTGELVWNAKDGLVTIDTDRTAGAIGFLDLAPLTLKGIALKTSTPFGAVYVTSLEDDRAIDEARHILVSAVGPARNTGMEDEQTDQTGEQFGTRLWHLKSVGTAPILLRAIEGELSVRNANAGALKAWALDINGKRRMEVPLKVRDGAVVLTMDAAQEAVYYEIAAE